jgi:hypothetical protein
MTEILGQLARSGLLLLPDVSAAILAEKTPALEQIVLALVITTMDAHAVTVGDPQSTWTEKRQARMALAAVFLSALAVLREA